MMKNQRMLGILDLILGILLFLSGIFALTHPLEALTGMTMVYGLLAAGTGIVDIIFYVKMERRTGFGPVMALVSGVFSILMGLLLLLHPAAGSLSLALLFPIWFIAHCVSEFSRLPLIRWTAGSGYYYFALIVNIIGLIVGVMMLFSPVASMLSLPWMAGFYLLLLGLNSIILGLQKIIFRR